MPKPVFSNSIGEKWHGIKPDSRKKRNTKSTKRK